MPVAPLLISARFAVQCLSACTRRLRSPPTRSSMRLAPAALACRIHCERSPSHAALPSIVLTSHSFSSAPCLPFRSFIKEFLGSAVGADADKMKAQIERQNKLLADKDAQIQQLQKQVWPCCAECSAHWRLCFQIEALTGKAS